MYPLWLKVLLDDVPTQRRCDGHRACTKN